MTPAQPCASAPEASLPLAQEAKTKDGQAFNPASAVWRLRTHFDGGNLYRANWRSLDFSEEAQDIAKWILADKAKGQMAKTVINNFRTLYRFSRWWRTSRKRTTPFSWSLIAFADFLQFHEHSMNTASRGNELVRLRLIYEHGVGALRHPHFSEDVLRQASTIHGPGNDQGRSIRAGDADKGELDAAELELLREAVHNEAYSRKHRAITGLCLELGRNSNQYTRLRNRDLTSTQTSEGPRDFGVEVVRHKKQTAHVERRSWPISESLGTLLESLKCGEPDAPLLWWLPRNSPEAAIRDAMNRLVKAAGLISPRTKRPLHLSPRRLRYTLLTEAADQGASPEQIAALADHSDTRTVRIYVENSPQFLVRIGERLDAIYSPLVKRFKGRLANIQDLNAEESQRLVPGAAAQIPESMDIGEIGACGASGLCRLAPPLTCYACPKFIALRRGPHQKMAAALEARIKNMSPRMALQLAPVLAAVREVIRMIREEDK